MNREASVMERTNDVSTIGPKNPLAVGGEEHTSTQSSLASSLTTIPEAKPKNRKLLRIGIGTIIAMVVILSLVLGLVLGLAHSHNTPKASKFSLSVDLGYSTYNGTNEKNGVSQWLGIRYAAAPEGNLRFRAPQDPVPDGKSYQATNRGPLCHGTPSTKFDPNNKEDCLFLNVFAPTANTGLHPVYVFFQGGGFNQLSSPNLDGNSLINAADHDLVIVTFNYRIGPYGFLASNEVQADGDINVGLLDQRKVLHWIQKYIHLFGGNSAHVTIGGASAGAASVDLQMSAYGGRDDKLFVAAAAESQSFGAQLTITESQYQYDALISRVNCSTAANTLQCLRNLDIKILAENNMNIPTPGGAGKLPLFMYSNVIDGNFTTDYTYKLFAEGKYVHVPSIFGDDTNEGTIFTPNLINTQADMNDFLKNNFAKLTTEQLAKIDSLYPNTNITYPSKGKYWRTAANAYGEMRYNCPGINISATLSAAGVPSYNYHWDILSTANTNNGMGVTHTAEVSSIWGDSSGPDNAYIEPIQAYWTSFLRTGDPNTFKSTNAPRWEAWGGNGESMQRLRFKNLGLSASESKVGMESVPIDQRARCEYLSSIGVALGQ